MRVMGIDYGDRRIGIAVSDISGSICGQAWILEEWDMDKAAERITEEAVKRDVEVLVLGMPKNMDGSLGFRAEKTEEFKKLLEDKSGLTVKLWDERLTTVGAARILSDNKRYGKKRKSKLDAVAASLILEGYLGAL